MSQNELIVIIVGLVAGWLIVSRVVSSGEARPGVPDGSGDGSWHDLLGVSPGASRTEIEAAYDAKRNALDAGTPRIATIEEQRAVQQQRATLEAAYREAIAQIRRKTRKPLG